MKQAKFPDLGKEKLLISGLRLDEKNLLSSNRENGIAKLTCNADERGQMLRIAVCDDEKYYRGKIMKLLKEEFGKRELQDYVIDEYVAGTELLEENHFLVYDIIFLDINMQLEKEVC